MQGISKFALALWGVFGLFCSLIRADEGILPGVEQYRAAMRGKDCSIYRTLAQRTLRAMRSAKVAMEGQFNQLHRAHSALVSCASSQGLDGYQTQEREYLMAELCSKQYQLWLAPSYRIRILREDLKTAEQSHQSAKVLVGHFCGKLPQVRS